LREFVAMPPPAGTARCCARAALPESVRCPGPTGVPEVPREPTELRERFPTSRHRLRPSAAGAGSASPYRILVDQPGLWGFRRLSEQRVEIDQRQEKIRESPFDDEIGNDFPRIWEQN